MSEVALIATLAALSMLIGALLGKWLCRRKTVATPQGLTEERRNLPFSSDQEKFATQRNVTYILLLIFATTGAWILHENDQSERSMFLQTVINLTLLAVGYWLGASKAAADSGASLSRVAEAAPKQQERAVAAARAPAPDEAIPPEIIPNGAVTPAPTNPETGVTPAAEVAKPPNGATIAPEAQPERKP